LSTRTLAAPLLLAAVLALAGAGLVRREPVSSLQRAVLGLVAGVVMLHAALGLGDLLGVGWSPVFAAAALTVGAGLPRLLARGSGPERIPAAPAGWGDALALVAIAGFAALAASRWIGNPDFVYHWGLKGHRFLLVHGVDYPYLARPWHWVIHPDYPNLYPALLAATAVVAGMWNERGLFLWSPLLLLALVLSVRETLAAGAVPNFRRHAVVAAVALGGAAFGIGHQMAGAADWLLCLALVVALPALLRQVDGAGDLRLGLCAALAAGAKLEGLPLALFLVLVQLARHVREQRRVDPRAIAALALPTVLVAAPWAWGVARYGLFQRDNVEGASLAQLAAVSTPLLRAINTPAWHGLAYLVLLLPLLVARTRVRSFATVAVLQLAFYLWSYAASPLDDVAFLVLTSFPRLLLHLWPATIAAAAIAWLAAPEIEAAEGSGGGTTLAASEGGSRRAAHLDHLADDGDGDLARRVAADRQPDGGT
jgi:hypothetical protein